MKSQLTDLESSQILFFIAEISGNVRKVAEETGVSAQTILGKKKYQIDLK
jgi:hypothetical protein